MIAIEDGLCFDRSSRPRRSPRRLTAAEEESILRARRETNLGPARLAGIVRRARSTVWKVLHRHGLSRRRRGERRRYRRYEWSRPGTLLHMDVKRVARFRAPGHRVGQRRDRRENRGAGYEYPHCVVDAGCPALVDTGTLGSFRSIFFFDPFVLGRRQVVEGAVPPDRVVGA